MRLRWNPEGKGRREVPSAFSEFARAKRREFFFNMLACALIGIAITHAIDWVKGKADAFSAVALLNR